MNIPRGLANLLMEHRKRQEEERDVMDELWTDTGFMFTTNSALPLIREISIENFPRSVSERP